MYAAFSAGYLHISNWLLPSVLHELKPHGIVLFQLIAREGKEVVLSKVSFREFGEVLLLVQCSICFMYIAVDMMHGLIKAATYRLLIVTPAPIPAHIKCRML